MGMSHHNELIRLKAKAKFVIKQPVFQFAKRTTWNRTEFFWMPNPDITMRRKPVNLVPGRRFMSGNRDVRVLLGKRGQRTEQAARHIPNRVNHV